jgi:hypothetical protein
MVSRDGVAVSNGVMAEEYASTLEVSKGMVVENCLPNDGDAIIINENRVTIHDNQSTDATVDLFEVVK